MICKICFAVSFLFLSLAPAGASETITGKEIQAFFYSDGKMKKSEPQFEITYFINGDSITRTRVYDFKKKEVIPDNTTYNIQRQLFSDVLSPMHEADKALGGKDVIRAIGQPGMDAVETVVISGDYINSYKSTSDYLVISRQKIIR